MIKQKQYDWKDSNLALFGSDTERQVKKESAEQEKAWKKAGQKCGLQIWRIVKFKVTEWPQEDYGKFFDGDSYIILNTYKEDGSEALLYDVHFWIGKFSTQDEYGTAAYKTVELDTYLDDVPIQHREVQGHESDLFRSYFKEITYLHGGADSGFRSVKPEEYTPRLFHFHGDKSGVTVKEVVRDKSRLDDTDVYILDLGLTIYQWNGQGCNKDERFQGLQYVNKLKAERSGKRVQVEVIDQNSSNPDEEDFMRHLDGGKEGDQFDSSSDFEAVDKTKELFRTWTFWKCLIPDSEEFETYLSKVSDEELKENIPNANIPQPDQQAEPSAKRFKSVTEEEMKILFDSRQAKATQRNTAWGMKIFQEWNMEVFGECINMNTVAVSNLAACLSRFYCEARPQAKSQGEENPLYHKNTLINIRAAINRHLADIRRDINIVKDKEFRTANGILDGLFKERTRLGLSKPITHKQIIERQDLEKIYQYFQCGALKSPVVLRQAVWYFLAIHFVTRGLEFHHQLRIDSFEFSSDGTGEFASLRHETLQKNHQGGLSSTDCHTDKRMYASGTDCCPVRMLKNLIERTDKEATHLFNQYIKDRVLDPHTWFSSKPLQKRTFSSFLADICKAAGVEKRYTPHCLRATAISFLNDHGFEARHIMFMSNHRNESSIRSYNRSLSTNQKKSISASLTSMASASSVSSVDSQTALALPPSSAASTPCQTLDLVPSVSSPGDSMMSATTSATFNMQNINPSTGFFHQASFNNCVFHFK